jgi:hypothetical protein
MTAELPYRVVMGEPLPDFAEFTTHRLAVFEATGDTLVRVLSDELDAARDD